MFKKLLPLLLASSVPAACAYPLISEIKNPPPVDVSVNEEKAVPIKVVPKTWTCPGCNTNEKYVLEKLQEYSRKAAETLQKYSTMHFLIRLKGQQQMRCSGNSPGILQEHSSNPILAFWRYCRKSCGTC